MIAWYIYTVKVIKGDYIYKNEKKMKKKIKEKRKKRKKRVSRALFLYKENFTFFFKRVEGGCIFCFLKKPNSIYVYSAYI